MRKFVFRLESVLRVRQAREEALLGELAGARRLCEEQRAQLALVRSDREAAFESARARRLQEKDPQADAAFCWWADVLAERIALQEERLNQAQEAVDAKLAETLEAMKERKALDKLKERHQVQYLQQLAREEAGVLDEFAALQVARRRSA